MTVYYIYYFIVIAFYLLQSKIVLSYAKAGQLTVNSISKNRRNQYFVIIATGLLVLIIGLRSEEMGVDLVSYLPSFTRLNNFSWEQLFSLDSYLNYEKGYIFFNKTIGSISTDYNFFLFVCAAVSIIPIGIFVYKNSTNVLLSFLVNLSLPTFLVTFSALRQAIAIGITVLAFEFIKRRKPLWFIVTTLLAACFHSSAAIFLIAYPLYYIKTGKNGGWISAIALPIIYMLRFPMFEVLSKIFKKNAAVDNNGALMLFVVFSIVYIFCLFFGDRKNNERTNGLSNIFWAACAIQALGGVYSIVIRVGYYFMLYLVLLLPEVFEDMKNRLRPEQRQVVLLIVGVCFLVYGLYAIRNGGWAETYPYSFFWTK